MESQNIAQELLEKYQIKDMDSWENVNADLIITDPPFGIRFGGKNGNYNRNVNNVVDGYVEWDVNEYAEKIDQLLRSIYYNLKEDGQALIFSGWNNSYIIHQRIKRFKDLSLRGKLYWTYNFAPACQLRPAHNVYEIFWVTKSNIWTYNRRCTTSHCQEGESNLTTLNFKRDYKKNMPKYPTRLPFELLKSLLEHFSDTNDLIFDPLAGSGMVGVVSQILNRDFILGDLNTNGKIVFEHLLGYYLDKKPVNRKSTIYNVEA